MNVKAGNLFDTDMVSNIRELVSRSSEFKSKIYKSLLMNSPISSPTISEYMSYINGFISSWENYSEKVFDAIKNSKAVVGSQKVIDYDYIRDYIYSNYDYASILQFADGILEGVSKGNFKTPEDIKDFRDHTASKALHADDAEVAAVLHNVIGEGIIGTNWTNCDIAAVAKYNAIRSYKIFDKTDARELFKSIDKTIQFITGGNNIEKYVSRLNMKLFIAVLNNILDYITLSLAVYACRIFIIDKYARGFYLNSSVSVNESTEEKDYSHISIKNAPSAEGSNNVETRSIIEVDDAVCRDLSKIKEFYDSFLNFLRVIGANVESKDLSFDAHYSSRDMTSNLFCQKLISNPIHTYFRTHRFIDGEYENPLEDSVANELNHSLKSFMYNNLHSLEGSSSPKNEILHVYRGTEPESNTIDGYRNLAIDLYTCSIDILKDIAASYNGITAWKARESRNPRQRISITNIYSECAKMLNELYRDLAMAVLQKARDIEMQINRLRNAEVDKTMINLKLDVPAAKKDDITDSNMTPVVPDTTRMPIDLMDLYTLPAFESYEMYDEYLRTLPEFANDMYLMEDLDMSAVWNNIMAALQGLINYILRFFQNKSVQAAFNYVKTHKNELLSMTFNGQSGMEVLPYQENINIAHAKNFSNNLAKFKEDTDLANDESLKKFIISLYPDEETYKLFNEGNVDKKKANEAYRNKILFGKTDNIERLRLTTNEEIKKQLENWIGTLEQGNDLFQSIKKIIDEMSRVMSNFKTKLPAITTKAVQNMQQNTNNTPPSMNNDGNKNTSTTSQSNNQSQNNMDKVQMVNKLINEVRQVQINTILPLQGIIIQIIKDEYRYIQEAYSIGSKNNPQ